MQKMTAILSLLLISFTAQAKYIQNLGEVGMFPLEDKKLETLQVILLNSAEKAFAGTGPITFDTSLVQKRMYRQIDFRSFDTLLLEAKNLVVAEGCSMNIEREMGQKIYSEVKFDGRGSITTIGDLLPILNMSIDCP